MPHCPYNKQGTKQFYRVENKYLGGRQVLSGHLSDTIVICSYQFGTQIVGMCTQRHIIHK